MEMYNKLEQWLDDILSDDIPSEVKGFLFNIYEDEGDGWSMSLVGTGSFEPEDDDYEWACDDVTDFGTEDDLLIWEKDASWEEVLEDMKSVLDMYLDKGTYSEVLKSCGGVGVGFVDGDVEILYSK